MDIYLLIHLIIWLNVATYVWQDPHLVMSVIQTSSVDLASKPVWMHRNSILTLNSSFSPFHILDGILNCVDILTWVISSCHPLKKQVYRLVKIIWHGKNAAVFVNDNVKCNIRVRITISLNTLWLDTCLVIIVLYSKLAYDYVAPMLHTDVTQLKTCTYMSVNLEHHFDGEENKHRTRLDLKESENQISSSIKQQCHKINVISFMI